MKIREIRAFIRRANYGRPLKVEEAIEDLPPENIKGYECRAMAFLMIPIKKTEECLIIIFPLFFEFGEAGQRFVLLHEVGHLYVDFQEQGFDKELDEHAANCWARERAREMGDRVRRPALACDPAISL